MYIHADSRIPTWLCTDNYLKLCTNHKFPPSQTISVPCVAKVSQDTYAWIQ